MEDYQLRVVSEKADLDLLIFHLENFIETNPEYKELEKSDQDLLQEQLEVMIKYSEILDVRITRFKSK